MSPGFQTRVASRVRTRPHPSRRARAPTHKRHTPAPHTNPAPFTCQAHTPRRCTRTTPSTRPRTNPLQPTWPRRPPCTRSPLPPTSTQTLFCHSRFQPATSGPWHTHTRRSARVQHTTFTLIPHVPIHASQSSHLREKPVTSSECKKSFLTGATTVLFGANQSQPSQPVSSRHNPSQPVSTRLNPTQPVSHQSQPMI